MYFPNILADKMATIMPSFTLQPHHLAISYGIARMQGPLSDIDNSLPGKTLYL